MVESVEPGDLTLARRAIAPVGQPPQTGLEAPSVEQAKKRLRIYEIPQVADLPGVNKSITTVTGTTYTLDNEDVLLVDDDTAGADVTITLPPAATATKKRRDFKKLGTTANVIIDADGTETIDGELTITLLFQYENLTLMSDGVNWVIL